MTNELTAWKMEHLLYDSMVNQIMIPCLLLTRQVQTFHNLRKSWFSVSTHYKKILKGFSNVTLKFTYLMSWKQAQQEQKTLKP
jgi:hypothetical protein